MNDRYDAGHGGGDGPYELVGYDEYGLPVYRQAAQQQPYDPQSQQQSWGDAYGGADGYGRADAYGQPQGYGWDPYAGGGGQGTPYPDAYPQGTQGTQGGYGAQPPAQQPYAPYGGAPQDPPAGPPQPAGPQQYDDGAGGWDAFGHRAGGAARQQPQQPRAAEQTQTAYIPQQARPAETDAYGSADPAAPADRAGRGRAAEGRVPDAREPRETADREGTQGGPAAHGDGERLYETSQFAFVEEPDGDSEDVINWLNFTENRTERREEAKRRARNRLVALTVVLALALAGGVGYLWWAGKLPGSSSGGKGTTAVAPSAQKRDVIVVHLHNTKGGGTSTALLVDNTTTQQGTTVLLPNALAVAADDGSTTTLAKSVEDDGSSGTREALDTVLGTSIQGTWRLDTPYLQNLVDLVGTIEVDTDTDVPDPDARKKGAAPLVKKGSKQSLSGKMAVAYATHLASGEAQDAQLQRFGQVMQGVLRKMSSDADAATITVQTLAQILDPSLTDKDLGTFLARLADLAKGGDYRTELLPVQSDGTLSAEAADTVVKNVLGGTAKSPDADAATRVSVRNATGVKDNTEDARIVLLNGGFTFVDGGSAAAQATSRVVYADDAAKDDAEEVAKTLGLSDKAVAKGKVSGSAQVSVVLGQDYKPGAGSR